MKTGRNDPCPCGSGRKHKKCCLASGPDPVNYVRQKLILFQGRFVETLMRHGRNVFSPQAIVNAADEFFLWPDDEDEREIDIDPHEAVFFPWFLFKWRIESMDDDGSLPGPRDLSIVRSYLQRHGGKLDSIEREYLESFSDAPLSFFEVTAIEPGKSVSLRDLLLERDHCVLDKIASGVLRERDIVFGSIVAVGGISVFGAISMIAFKPSAKVGVFAVRDKMLRGTGGNIIAATLDDYSLEIRDLYLDLFASMTSMPKLCNTDGDDLSFHSLHYEILSPQRVFDSLKGLTSGFVSEEELLDGAECDARGELLKVEIPWLLAANERHEGMENTLHGTLIIDGSRMTCEANSAERAGRLRNIIAEALPETEAKYKTTVLQSMDAMPREEPLLDEDAGREQEDMMKHPEVRAMIDQMMRKHWEAWPDIELPALRGKTPRQAVRGELGRQQVIALLEDAEAGCRASDGSMGSIEILRMVRRGLGIEET